MDPERWQHIQSLFHEALALPPAQRAAFLETKCADDADLRRQVEALLAADDDPLPVFDASLDALAAVLPEKSTPDTQSVGPYRLLKEIGRGGMGTVYLAERADDQFEKRVALKLVKRGMDTDEILRRFRYERQILATLEHPNIARLYDGGITRDERPYLAMEYVDGSPIDQYCDAHRLGVEARLKLFVTVCEAVHYAHQNLVVHRDLKPSNILVTETGQVKLLDFGIAKLLSDEAPGVSVPVTRTGVRVMTPEYAAPEQIRGEAVTTVADVYALGVVLYELLTGRRPYGTTGQRAAEIEQAILKTEPERPSTAVMKTTAYLRRDGTTETITPKQVSAVRATSAERLQRRLQGDLDTIVLKALRKEPERRYASAEALLEDIQRHLAGMPVTARPDTFGYRTGKFVRRHRLGVLGLVIAFLLITGVAVAMAYQRTEVARERDAAEALATFLEDMFGTSDPMLPQPERRDTLRARDLLDRGARQARTELADQPRARARMLHVLGRVYLNLALYDDAEALLKDALATRRTFLDAGHPDIAETLQYLGQVMWRTGRLDEADSLLRVAQTIRTQAYRTHHPAVASILALRGIVDLEKGNYDDAERLTRTALDVFRATLGKADYRTVKCLQNLGHILQRQGRYQEAEPILREALDRAHAVVGDHHALVALTLGNLSVTLAEQGLYDEAVRYGKEGVAISEELLGPRHTHTLSSKDVLGVALTRQGAFDEAEQVLSSVLETRREMRGPRDVAVGQSLNLLGLTLSERGAWHRAEPLFRESTALFREKLGPDHPFVAISLVNLGRALTALGTLGEAETSLRQALDIFETRLGEDHLYTSYPLVGLGWAKIEQQQPEAAETYLRRALEIRRAHLAEDHAEVAEAETLLGAALTAQQRYEEAEPLLLHSYEAGKDAPDQNLKRFLHEHLVAYYQATGRPDEAARYEAAWAHR